MKIFKVEHCYMQSGEPIRCPHCGGTDLQGEVSEIANGHIAEESTRCTGCNKIIAFWAYGSYQPSPHFIYHRSKVVKSVINWFIKKGFTK